MQRYLAPASRGLARVARAQQRSLSSKIIYTHTDEAPALATYALLPIVQRFTGWADIALETADISVAARIIAGFPECLSEAQRKPDTLAELGELAKTPEVSAHAPDISTYRVCMCMLHAIHRVKPER